MKYSRSGREKIIKEEACSPLDNYIIKHTGLAGWGRLAFRGLIYINSLGAPSSLTLGFIIAFCVRMSLSFMQKFQGRSQAIPKSLSFVFV